LGGSSTQRSVAASSYSGIEAETSEASPSGVGQ
jgi:hypothetical protein